MSRCWSRSCTSGKSRWPWLIHARFETVVGSLKKQLKVIEGQIETAVQADEPNARKVEILNSVKGVGPVTVSTIRTFYQRLLAKGKPKKVALTAAMRKLLTILNALVKSNQLWRVPTLCPVK